MGANAAPQPSTYVPTPQGGLGGWNCPSIAENGELWLVQRGNCRGEGGSDSGWRGGSPLSRSRQSSRGAYALLRGQRHGRFVRPGGRAVGRLMTQTLRETYWKLSSKTRMNIQESS